MARHARGAQPTEEPATGRSERRHARAAATKRRRRRTGGLLAVCATALAAGAGAVVTGVLPVSDRSTVAGDVPLGGPSPADPDRSGASASDQATSGGDPMAATTEPGPSPSATVTLDPGDATRAGSSPAADRGEARPTLTSPSATASAPTATASPTPSRTATAKPSAAPSPKPPPPTTASPAASPAAAVLNLVNAERKKVGCGPLTADARLGALAQAFSDDMAARSFFDHTDPDGHTPWDRAKAAGISYLSAENIARGQSTPEAVMASWMNSPGHRANILNCDYTKLGTSVHNGAGGPWWTQDFGF
ncbi:CAP domain-containing protein [Kitasatospora sp. NPDC050543]|uniref:CAP domain-containing protein n=1 Tax=Kitasatospora sp. NPDC050543 TaxID=3364054 RepID=UPI0037B28766